MKEFYLARDSRGELTLFNEKPYKKKWECNKEFPKHFIEFYGWSTKQYDEFGIGFLVVDSNLYPEVTFENSPKKITFKIE